MKYSLPIKVKNILESFSKAGFKIYIVGGSVRDLLLNRVVKDWDFTTNATPEQILQIIPEGFYDNKFGTVGLSNNSQIYEITTMRKEGIYTDFRHPLKVSWTDNIKEDLNRRDFTINAMAMDQAGEIIDPFGGQKDLKDKLIQAVGNPKKRFQEDALRLIRAIRLTNQLQFQIEPKTFESIKTSAKLITKISWERIRDELLKILATDQPDQGIVMLRSSNLLPYILPEIERCFGIVQQGPKHDRVYDIGQHSLSSLKYCASTDPLVRLTTLIHDVGKPDTLRVQPDGNVTFYGHDVIGGKIAKEIGQRLKLSNKQIDKLVRLVRWHLFTVDENQTDSAIRRFIKNVGLENIDDMMALRIGDRLGGGTQKAISWRMKKFRERIEQVLQKPFSVTDLKVNGQDVIRELNIQPSPKVGKVLNTLFKEVLEDSSKNNRDYLLKRLKELS